MRTRASHPRMEAIGRRSAHSRANTPRQRLREASQFIMRAIISSLLGLRRSQRLGHGEFFKLELGRSSPPNVKSRSFAPALPHHSALYGFTFLPQLSHRSVVRQRTGLRGSSGGSKSCVRTSPHLGHLNKYLMRPAFRTKGSVASRDAESPFARRCPRANIRVLIDARGSECRR